MDPLDSLPNAAAGNDQKAESAAVTAVAPRLPGILIVDDDQTICEMLSLLVDRLGFASWATSRSRTALEIYRRWRDRIDLVLLDVRMPEMDGPQTLAELKKLGLNAPCCFMSGHTGQYKAEDLMKMSGVRILNKPFRLTEIKEAICDIVPKAKAKPNS